MQTAIAGVGRGLVSELLPGMNQIMQGFTSLIIGEEGATEAMSAGFKSLFDSIGGISENIVSMISDMLPGIITGITEMLPQLIEMATSLLISLAEALVEALPLFITTVIPSLLEAAINIVMALGEAIISAGPQLIDAGISLIDTLKSSFSASDLFEKGVETVSGLLDGISQNLPGLLSEGVEIISSIVTGITQNIPQLLTTAGQLVSDFASFILTNLPEIASTAGEVIGQFLGTIAEHLPEILEQGVTLLGQLIVGLIQAIPDLVLAVGELILSFVNTISEYDWLAIGTDIVQGIINGLMGMIDSLVTAVKDLASAIWNNILDFFDIGSPSKLAAWAGQMIDEGLGGGIEDNADIVDDAINDLGQSAAAQLEMTPTFGDITPVATTSEQTSLDRLLNLMEEYLPQLAEGSNVNVTLEGDADGLFNVMRNKNKIYTKMNGQSAFA